MLTDSTRSGARPARDARGGDGMEPRTNRRELIGEPLDMEAATFDAADMARGAPGVPSRFRWRGQTYGVERVEGRRRSVDAEGYVRKHYFRVLTQTGECFEIYCDRQPKRGRDPRARWWLYCRIPRPETE